MDYVSFEQIPDNQGIHCGQCLTWPIFGALLVRECHVHILYCLLFLLIRVYQSFHPDLYHTKTDNIILLFVQNRIQLTEK